MNVRTEPDFTRQLPSGRLIRIDVIPMVRLLSKAKREANPAVLDFIDDYVGVEDYFRVIDLGQCSEVPDSTKPAKRPANLRKKKARTWTLTEVLRGESNLSEEDVKALNRSLGWGPMVGWMTKMINRERKIAT